MDLKSFAYIAFALSVVLLYYLFSHVKYAQSIILLCANVFFIYMTCGIRSVVLIALSSTFVFGMGILIEKTRAKSKSAAKSWMFVGVIAVIAFLCYFKFFKFTYTLLQELLAQNRIVISDLITPIGIAYYSLTMIAYLIDVYHKKYPAEKNFFYYLTFITYFPSIVEGPINMYKKVAHQFKEQHFYKSENFMMGFQRCIWGYFKKVVIADRIGILVNSVFNGGYDGPINLIAILLYSFQIYADFSGGIDIIMGISEMLDIKLTENFKSPLVSKNVTEFWQRWHISLGEFMEKYIYYPIVLGKRTRKIAKKIKNNYLQKVFAATIAAIVVFVIVGIWHGTGWNYVVYGCYQAFWVSTAILLAPVYKSIKTKLNINEKTSSWHIFVAIRTFGIMMIGRFFIKAKDLAQAFAWISSSFRFSYEGISLLRQNKLGLDKPNVLLMIAGIVLLIAVDIAHEKGIYFRERIARKNIVIRYAIYFIGIFSILVFGIYGAEFDSASFIYGGY